MSHVQLDQRAGGEDEDLPEKCCWSLRVGFSVACQVPQMLACSSETPSGRRENPSGWGTRLHAPPARPPLPLQLDRMRVTLTFTVHVISHVILSGGKRYKFPPPPLTLGSPRIAGRNLTRDVEDPPSAATAAAGAPRLRPPLTQHWRVVVIGRHLTAGHLVGVAGGAALAEAVGLLGPRQLRAPAGWGGGGGRGKRKGGRG